VPIGGTDGRGGGLLRGQRGECGALVRVGVSGGLDRAGTSRWRRSRRVGGGGRGGSSTDTASRAKQVGARRRAWFEEQPDLDPRKFVFIDETWASTALARTPGRALRGERLRAALPHERRKTTTFVAELRNTRMVAPMVLVPELRPGDVVIMDDLGSHKGAGVRVVIKAASASLRYLPPYRLDFNPIENAFAKLKAMFRKAVERTLEALWSTVVSIIETFAPPSAPTILPPQGTIQIDRKML